jgi:hypothetical protein
MVGRQTSYGCGTCRQRRVKCDEQKPTCVRCTRAGRVCTGYAQRWFASSPQPQSSMAQTTVPNSLSTVTDQLRSKFVSRLEGDALTARLMMMPVCHVFRHIPSRIGHSLALDDAVACISDGGSDSKLYVKALETLRKAVENGVPPEASQTVAAAFILQTFEQYRSAEQKSMPLDGQSSDWLSHASGVVKMLQSRPASTTSEGLEKAVLEAEVANVFIPAMITSDNHLVPIAVQNNDQGTYPFRDEIDPFLRSIIDDADSRAAVSTDEPIFGRCRADTSMDRQQAIRMIDIWLSGFMRTRVELKARIRETTPEDTLAQGAGHVAAYAAAHFYLLIVDTVLMTLDEDLQRESGHSSQSLKDHVSLVELVAESGSIPQTLTEYFSLVDASSQEMGLAVRRLLKITLIATMGRPGLNEREAVSALALLDQELQFYQQRQQQRLGAHG